MKQAAEKIIKEFLGMVKYETLTIFVEFGNYSVTFHLDEPEESMIMIPSDRLVREMELRISESLNSNEAIFLQLNYNDRTLTVLLQDQFDDLDSYEQDPEYEYIYWSRQ
jgi:hypothetical protein